MYGGKFVFQNRLGQPYSWKEITVFALFYFVNLRAVSKFKPLGGLIFWGGGAIKWRVFCVMSLGGLYLEGLIFGILRCTIQERLLLYECLPDARALIAKQGALLNGKFKMDLMYGSGQLTWYKLPCD